MRSAQLGPTVLSRAQLLLWPAQTSTDVRPALPPLFSAVTESTVLVQIHRPSKSRLAALKAITASKAPNTTATLDGTASQERVFQIQRMVLQARHALLDTIARTTLPTKIHRLALVASRKTHLALLSLATTSVSTSLSEEPFLTQSVSIVLKARSVRLMVYPTT